MNTILQFHPVDILVRFSEAVDQRRPDAIAACFTSDGVFRPGEIAIIGSHNIREFYRERLSDPRRKTRHVWANVTTKATGPETLTITALLTNYAFEPQVSNEVIQMRIGDVECHLVRHADGEWLFAKHLYERAFAIQLPLAASPADRIPT